MGRQLRIVIPGQAYHVMSRGNERRNIFRQDGDYRKLLAIIKKAKSRYDFKLYAYTLMTNHYHLLIKIEKANLSDIMQEVNGAYSAYFNRKYKRKGYFFENRFKSVIVEHGQNLLEELRYIHLNPLRAGMVERLDQYPWTSHNQYRGGFEKGFAEPDHLLGLFAKTRLGAVPKYEAYMGEGTIKDNDGDTMGHFGQCAIGSKDFIREIKMMFKDKVLPRDICGRVQMKEVIEKEVVVESALKYYKITRKKLEQKGRWNKIKPVVIYLLAADSGLKNTEIGQVFGGLYGSGVGRVVEEIGKRVTKDKELAKEVEGIREKYKEVLCLIK